MSTRPSYSIELYKGRNNRNVGINRTGRTIGFGANVSNASSPFTVYVPGLAGIPHFEEFRNEGVVLRKVAGGEANLVLRNVLLLIYGRELSDELDRLLSEVFPNLRIKVEFDQRYDQNISVEVSTNNGFTFVPIDMVGTGVLQAIQIFAYAVLFKPKILLLDEPDSHLHPSNQVLLNRTLETVADYLNGNIILATHSRHLINSCSEEVTFFWLEKGRLKTGADVGVAKILMDLGALDNADKIIGSDRKYLFLVEDERTEIVETMIRSAGYALGDFDIVPYFGVTHSDAAANMMRYLKDVLGGDRIVIVHRDRDFLTDDELHEWQESIAALGFEPFVTRGSDIESYFLDPAHLSDVSGLDQGQITTFLADLIRRDEAHFRKRFREKRREANMRLHRDGGGPSTDDLCPPEEPLRMECVVGKDLVKRIRGRSNDILGQVIEPVAVGGVALAEDFSHLIREAEIRLMLE